MNQKLRNLVYTAMLMALCCVATVSYTHLTLPTN